MMLCRVVAKWQRLFKYQCGPSFEIIFTDDDRWSALIMHALMVLTATFRFLMHQKNPTNNPRWSRKVRFACRCAAAFLPLILSIPEPGFDGQVSLFIGTNLLAFMLERYGRVTVEEVNHMIESHHKPTPAIDQASIVKADNPLENSKSDGDGVAII
jgi:hypothetical protein